MPAVARSSAIKRKLSQPTAWLSLLRKPDRYTLITGARPLGRAGIFCYELREQAEDRDILGPHVRSQKEPQPTHRPDRRADSRLYDRRTYASEVKNRCCRIRSALAGTVSARGDKDP